MFHLITIGLLIAYTSAHFYDYGYHNYYPGVKKGNDFNNYRPSYYPNRYGDDYNYPYHHQFNRNYWIKQLPPIYKDVKVPVIVRQPVIIRKIPVIHKKKEVTIKKEPPIVQIDKNPTVIEKGFRPFGSTPDINIEPMIGIEQTKMMKKDKIPLEVMPSVEYDIKKMIENPIEEKTDFEENMDSMKDMKDMKDMLGMGKHMIDIPMRMKNAMKGPIDVEDDGIGDFDTKDFEVQKFKAKYQY